MKKIITLVLICAMALMTVACGEVTDDKSEQRGPIVVKDKNTGSDTEENEEEEEKEEAEEAGKEDEIGEDKEEAEEAGKEDEIGEDKEEGKEEEQEEEQEEGKEEGKEEAKEEAKEEKTEIDATTPVEYEEIIFGSYEQDGNLDNGKEEIEWRVLATVGNKKLVVSKYALYTTYFTDQDFSTWENSTIRNELNTVFYNEAFSDAEKQKIVESEVDISVMDPEHYGEFLSEGTVQDYVFLLSVPEIEQYFKIDLYGFNAYYVSGYDLRTTSVASDHNADRREFTMDDYEFDMAGVSYGDFYPESVIGTLATYWYTRTVARDGTVGLRAASITSVDPCGSTHEFIVDMESSIRPAMWIEMNE